MSTPLRLSTSSLAALDAVGLAVLLPIAAQAGEGLPIARDPQPPVLTSRAGWDARGQIALEKLETEWGRADGWQGAGGWQRFVLVDILMAYRARTGDTSHDTQIHTALRTRDRLALNDDVLWAIIASVDGYQLEGDHELLDYAATRFRALVTDYWDDTCGGGIWWNPRRTYKNAITNELLVTAATRLYRATGQEEYRAWALRGWQWFEASGMIGADGLVNDGLAIAPASGACTNNGKPRWTYNQGVILSGLSDLTDITGDPAYRERAVAMAKTALAELTHADGTLREPVPSIGIDGLAFKGIFAFHLAALMDRLPEGPDKQVLRDAARRNGSAIWRISGEGTQPIDSDWTGAKAQYGAAAQASGLAMLLAAGR